jgi:Uma2 family endonuclease
MAMAISLPQYTVDDLDRFPDDGNRYELLDGVLLVTPAPAAVHQLIANRIQVDLSNALMKTGHAHIVGPGVVVRRPKTQLQPDVLVYPSRFPPTTDWKKVNEHWLAVEIFSRSSRFYDREYKRDAYFKLGVQQVWLVDWRERVVEVCKAIGKTRRVRDVIRWRVPHVGVTVVIDLAEVFAGIE